MRIKLIILIISFCWCQSLFSQIHSGVYQPEMLYFYWNYDNVICWHNFDGCDSTELVLTGGYFQKKTSSSGIVRVGRGTISTKIYLNGYLNNKIVRKDSLQVEAGPIPLPNIYIEVGNGIAIWENIEILGISHMNQEIIRNWTGFYIKKNRNCPMHLEYDIIKWNIIVSNKEFFGTGKRFPPNLINALKNIKSGDKVVLYSITVSIPSINYSFPIKLKSELLIK